MGDLFSGLNQHMNLAQGQMPAVSTFNLSLLGAKEGAK